MHLVTDDPLGSGVHGSPCRVSHLRHFVDRGSPVSMGVDLSKIIALKVKFDSVSRGIRRSP